MNLAIIIALVVFLSILIFLNEQWVNKGVRQKDEKGEPVRKVYQSSEWNVGKKEIIWWKFQKRQNRE